MSASQGTIPAGIRAWLPALVILIGMPLLALTTTKYVLIPSIKAALTPGMNRVDPVTEVPPMCLVKIPFPDAPAKTHAGGIRCITVVGSDDAFAEKVSDSKSRLASVAASDLRDVTASQLYKNDVLEAVRSQLLTDLNRTLGKKLIQQVYISVWPGS